MNNSELYVNVSEFQKKVLEFINSGELDKYFESTVFNNHEHKNDCKSAMMTGMSFASMLTSDCQIIVLDDNLMKKEIELINKIIAEAVLDGGDSGGPFYSNYDGLYGAINNWLEYHNITAIISNDEITTDNGASISPLQIYLNYK